MKVIAQPFSFPCCKGRTTADLKAEPIMPTIPWGVQVWGAPGQQAPARFIVNSRYPQAPVEVWFLVCAYLLRRHWGCA